MATNAWVDWTTLPDDLARRIALEGMSGPWSFGHRENWEYWRIGQTWPNMDVRQRRAQAQLHAAHAALRRRTVYAGEEFHPVTGALDYVTPRERAFRYGAGLLASIGIGAAAQTSIGIGAAAQTVTSLFRSATDTADAQMYHAEDKGKKPTKADTVLVYPHYLAGRENAQKAHEIPRVHARGPYFMDIALDQTAALNPIGDTTPRVPHPY